MGSRSALTVIAGVMFSQFSTASTLNIITSTAVGSEVTTRTNGISANIGTAANSGNSISYSPATTLGNQDIITYTLTNATFTNGPYILVDQINSAAVPSNLLNATSNQAGGTTLSFRLTNGNGYDATSDGAIMLASGTVGNLDNINVNFSNLAACDGCVTLAAQVTNSSGTLTIDTPQTQKLASVIQEFTGAVSGTSKTNQTIDVARSRVLFTDGTSQASFGIKFDEISAGTPALSSDGTRDLVLTAADSVRFTLSGDMSGVSSIVGDGNNAFTIDTSSNTATLTQAAVSTGSITTASQSYPVTITVDEATALATRTFNVTVELILADEANTTLVNNAQAAQWSINGMSARVSHLSLNVASFVNNITISNSGSTSADVEIGGTYTEAGGMSATVSETLVRAVPANGVASFTECDVLIALGLASDNGDNDNSTCTITATSVVDVSLTIEVAGSAENIDISVVKRSGSETVFIPVLYSTSANGGRTSFN